MQCSPWLRIVNIFPEKIYKTMFNYTPLGSACLLGACISAVAAVGSVFELSSGAPDYGTPITATILALSIPLCAGLFYVAVRSTNAVNSK
jgi:hypothetical protein